ncbi:hypothetical protein JYU34_002069 [Plutella xylostella]|uniref:Uncharacterized protein n=1 Tax=Plutella xylostella TaxID=51655 RepID=A0ABQ7R5H1_PLUXY|nr:hypothetical protein JYU34_002069 [Plutella xylostella]
MEVEEDDNFSDWQIVSPSVVESPLSPPSPTATEAAPPPAAAAAPVTHPLSDDTPDTNECARSEPVRGEGQCPAPGPSDEFYDADDDARSSPITPAVQEPPRRGRGERHYCELASTYYIYSIVEHLSICLCS